MTRNVFISLLLLATVATICGCGSSNSEHVEKPMTGPPAHVESAFDKLKSPQEKIDYINNSNAPKAEKDRAVQMIKSGKM